MIRSFLLLLLCSLYCTSCTKPQMMTEQTYATIVHGDTFAKVEKIAGAPYSSKAAAPGQREYEYIERLSMGSKISQEVHYFITVNSAGIVVFKRKEIEQRPILSPSYM